MNHIRSTHTSQDPRAQYGTPLLYRPHRTLVEAIEDRFATLSACEPAPADIPPGLLRKAWLVRCTGGALRWWLRRARLGHCRTPGGRGRLVDAFCAYRAARADLMLAVLGMEG
ncbi:MAG: hypothetical protein QNM00_01315 [Gammaproteobacteria bacterium]|nr:hypothetical protein [Gammaproteobacteria bacterium]